MQSVVCRQKPGLSRPQRGGNIPAGPHAINVAIRGRSRTVARVETGDPLLELIGDTHGLVTVEAFRWELLRALQRALPVDWISLNDLGPGPEDVVVLADPPPPPDLLEAFGRYAGQNPLVRRYQQTADGRALRFSDLVSQAELHQLDLYREVYAPLGIEHQMAFTLPNARTRILGVALSRRDSDFSEAERDLLERARPFMIQAYRNAISYSELLGDLQRREPPPVQALEGLGLTPRQAEVVRLLATGAPERIIARQLGISLRTVEKHLERAYRRLGVRNREGATELVWAAAG
jgi:DNA-binding CsgD family transcriptional regulator